MILNNKIFGFIFVTFLIGYSFQSISYFTNQSAWMLLAMWSPAIALLFLGNEGYSIFKELKNIKPKWILFALIIALLPYLINSLIYLSFNLGSINNDILVFDQNRSSLVEIKNVSLLLGTGNQSFSFFFLNLLLSILFGTFLTTILGALGEEIGWRGFLQSKLGLKFGVFTGTLLLGLIWGYWHIPANLGGANGTENIYLTTFLTFPVTLVFMSFVLAWFRIKSNAIWPCAFLHGMNNTVSGIALIKANSPLIETYVSLFSSILVGSIFAILLWKKQKN